jgi:3-oxoacyl-[acyl-carrier protein] reductase
MLARGWGRIVNVASTSGREPDEHYPAYGATKAALINLSKLLANVYSCRGVLTNCVCPGITRTEAAVASAVRRTGRTADDPRVVFEEYFAARRRLPAGRFGEPEDTAALVAFLCSERASWITGTCIDVDGGWVKSIL